MMKKSCNFWYFIILASIFGYFNYLFLNSNEQKVAYKYIVEINKLEKENNELKNKINDLKLKSNQ